MAVSDVTLARSGADLTLQIADSAGGTGGSIKLPLALEDNWGQGVDQVTFDDATSWGHSDFRARWFAQVSTSGNDSITGFNANDTITGASGANTITGGGGADVFRFADVSDTTVGSPDVITDFAQGTDKISLSTIDADVNTAGDQAFTWIGTTAFSDVAGQLRYDLSPSGARTIYGDVNGDGVADFAIQVTGATNFQATDFML